jgi:hypothetical protein
MRAIVVALLLCLPQIGAAQVAQVRCRQLQRSCQRGVSCLPPRTVDSFATGNVLGRLWNGEVAVLTVAHLIKGRYQSISVSVRGVWKAATLRAWHLGSEYGDLALVSFPHDGVCKSIRIADRPTDGTGVDIYVHTGKEAASWRARTADYHEIGKTSDGYTVLSSISIDIPPQAERGWSGSGVVFHGKLCGIIDSGGRSVRKSYGTSGQLIRAWLIDTIGYVPGDTAPVPPDVGCTHGEEIAELNRKLALASKPRDFLPAYEQEVEVGGTKHTIKLKQITMRYHPATGTVEVIDASGDIVDTEKYAPGVPVRMRFVQE